MTHEEAINRLKEEIDDCTPFADRWNEARLDIQALNMAIRALEQEPCEDAISRQAVLDLLEDTNNGWIINEVLQLPPVKPQEPKTGYREYNDIYDHYLCGNCKTVVMDYDNFCPNCGAKMD